MTTKNATKDFKNLTQKDVLVVYRGTKDVGKNYATNGMSQLKEFVREEQPYNLFKCVFLTDLTYM